MNSKYLPLSLLGLLAAAGPQELPAQDDVLTVERREDLRARDRLADHLRGLRCRIEAEAMGPRELARHLRVATGGKIPFLYSRRKAGADAVEPFDLSVHGVSVFGLMGLVQSVSGVRFVYRSGAVLLVPAGQVQPFTYLEIYDLRGPTAPLPDFPGPRLGLPGNEQTPMFGEEPAESGNTVSGFTADFVEELILSNVTPDAWGTGASLHNARGLFLIRHTVSGHRRIQRLLVRTGLLPAPVVIRETPRTPRRRAR